MEWVRRPFWTFSRLDANERSEEPRCRRSPTMPWSHPQQLHPSVNNFLFILRSPFPPCVLLCMSQDGTALSFSPQLPSAKLTAIRRLGFGTTDKMFVRYNANLCCYRLRMSWSVTYHENVGINQHYQSWLQHETFLFLFQAQVGVLASPRF